MKTCLGYKKKAGYVLMHLTHTRFKGVQKIFYNDACIQNLNYHGLWQIFKLLSALFFWKYSIASKLFKIIDFFLIDYDPTQQVLKSIAERVYYKELIWWIKIFKSKTRENILRHQV